MLSKKILGLAGSCLVSSLLMAGGKPFKVALLPNELFQHGFEKSITAYSINRHRVDFAIFSGDTKDGGSKCSNEIILDGLENYFTKLNVPTLYAVADNEWTDCHRISNGSYDPIERLEKIRMYFFSKNTMQGKNPLKVQREGKKGKKFSENSRLIYNNVMFVALNVVGSNNNLVITEKQCSKKSNRTKKDCDMATKEYKERNEANIKWLNESFEIAKKKQLSGIVIVSHANMYYPFNLVDDGYNKKFLPSLDQNNGFTDFFNTLVTQTHLFKGQVLLVMGDSHYFKIDKAMNEKDGTATQNFTRVVVFGGNETSWIELTQIMH